MVSTERTKQKKKTKLFRTDEFVIGDQGSSEFLLSTHNDPNLLSNLGFDISYKAKYGQN